MPNIFQSRLLKNAADYRSMFQPLIALSPKSEGPVNESIQWAKTALKKQNRIVWYLRWMRLKFVTDAEKSTPAAAEKLAQLKARYVKEAETGAGTSGGWVEYGVRAIGNVEALREKLEHYYSLSDPAIQGFDLKFIAPSNVIEDFKELEKAYIERAKSLVTPQKEDTVFIDCGGAWEWWLLPRASDEAEAKAMGHCGNAPARNRTDRNVLSLRQKKGTGKQNQWEPHLTFILHTEGATGEGILGEMKGKGNAKPTARYHPAIIQLLEDHRIKGIEGGGYMPSHNFQWGDLTPEQQVAVRKANPGAVFTFEELLEHEGITLDDIADRLGLNPDRHFELPDAEGGAFEIQSWGDQAEFIADCAVDGTASEVQACIDGDMEFFTENLLKKIPRDPGVFQGIAKQISREFHVMDLESPTIVDDVMTVMNALDDGGESVLRKGLEEALLTGYEYREPAKDTLKSLMHDQILFCSDDNDGEQLLGDVIVEGDEGQVRHYIADRKALEMYRKEQEDSAEETPEWGRPVVWPPMNLDEKMEGWRDAVIVLEERFASDRLSPRQLENKGQTRLFKRPETDEEAKRDGIRVSRLLQPRPKAASTDIQFEEIDIPAGKSSYVGTSEPGARIEATDGYRTIGAVEFYFREGNAYTRGIVVDQPYRGQGLGQQLYDHAIAYAKREGCKAFYSDTSNCMTEAAHKAWGRLKTRYPVEFEPGEGDNDYTGRRKVNLKAAAFRQGDTPQGFTSLLLQEAA